MSKPVCPDCPSMTTMTIEILYYNEGENPDEWLPALRAALPEANIRQWQAGDTAPADYALVWHPPEDLLRNRKGLKAVINLAAGVDALLASGIVPENVPVFRLEDAGMAIQMAEYVVYAVLRYFRRFDEYAQLQAHQEWAFLTPRDRKRFTVGIMGMGVMGKAAAEKLKPFGFPVKGWSRTPKQIEGVACYHDRESLSDFLKDVAVLVCLLPKTQETLNILDAALFDRLPDGAFLVNLGRGALLDERALLQALETGKIRAATLDVTAVEPLPKDHPFWQHPGITVTPHIAGLTFCDETVVSVAGTIRQLECGEMPTGLVDRKRGY